MSLYPFISILSVLILIYSYSKAKYLSPILLSLIYFSISSIWAINIGFCGDDIVTYLGMFKAYTFSQPFFFSPLEFSVGLITSFIKIVLPVTASAETIATWYRVCIFAIVPSFLILISNCHFQASLRFNSLLAFIALIPYSLLSSANIINNGLAITLAIYLLIYSFSRRVVLEKNHKTTPDIIELLILFFLVFSHPYGIALLIIYIAGEITLTTLKAFVPSSKNIYFLKFNYFSLFIFSSAFIFASFSASMLTSDVRDKTVIVSGLVLLLSLILLSFSFKYFLSRVYPYKYSATIPQKNLVQLAFKYFFFLAYLTLVCLSFIFFRQGDSTERFIAATISYNLLFSLVLFHYSSYFVQHISSTNTLTVFTGYAVSPRINIGFVYILSVLIMQAIYFFNSNAFLTNIQSSLKCL